MLFQPSFRSRPIQLNALSVSQVTILRKLAVLKMTALIERFSEQTVTENQWSVSRWMRSKLKIESTKKYQGIFGVPLVRYKFF